MDERPGETAVDPDAVAEGFEVFAASPFAVATGPLYVNRTGSLPIMGVFLDRQHANTMGAGHGGLLLTLADIALGLAVKAVLPVTAVAVTVDLHAMFMASTRMDEWIEARPTVDRVGRSMVFTTCAVSRGEETVARMAATFFVRHPAEPGEAASA